MNRISMCDALEHLEQALELFTQEAGGEPGRRPGNGPIGELQNPLLALIEWLQEAIELDRLAERHRTTAAAE